jgi:hypothetical protein
MIKKILIAVAVLIVLMIAAAAGVAYYVYRQVAPAMTQFAELAKLPDIEKDIRNQRPFEAPASAEISEQQIEKLLTVQSEVRKKLGVRLEAMETKYRALADKKDATFKDVGQMFHAYGDLASTWMEAKRAQVEALNAANLSLGEYQWVREQAYRSLGMMFVDMDFKKMVNSAPGRVSIDVGELRGTISDEALAANKAKLLKFKKVLEENLALAAFGL